MARPDVGGAVTGGFTANTSMGLLRRWADALHFRKVFHVVVTGSQPVHYSLPSSW